MTELHEQRPGAWRLAERLRWPAVVVVISLLAFFATVRACRTVREGQESVTDTVSQIGRTASGLAEGFKSGTITTTFVAAIPRLTSGSGTKLELAAYEATETFTRSDDRRVLYDLVPLGTTITEIRVPVTYRYHLRLDEAWFLEVRDTTCVVRAPAIRPSLPPAIHTHRLEKQVDSGWLRFDDDEQLDDLERTITPTVSARAADPDHIDLVRDRCRFQVADFVRNWLLVEDHWRRDRFSSVVVLFADEGDPPSDLPPPTLVLEAEAD